MLYLLSGFFFFPALVELMISLVTRPLAPSPPPAAVLSAQTASVCRLSFPFHPQVFLYLSLLSPVWLFNPPECMEDSFDIRRKDRLLRRGPVSSQPMGITGLRQPFLCCWHFFLLTPHSLPILFSLCSPHLSRVELLPFLRSCTKHQTRNTKAFALWTKQKKMKRRRWNNQKQTSTNSLCVSSFSTTPPLGSHLLFLWLLGGSNHRLCVAVLPSRAPGLNLQQWQITAQPWGDRSTVWPPLPITLSPRLVCCEETRRKTVLSPPPLRPCAPPDPLCPLTLPWERPAVPLIVGGKWNKGPLPQLCPDIQVYRQCPNLKFQL